MWDAIKPYLDPPAIVTGLVSGIILLALSRYLPRLWRWLSKTTGTRYEGFFKGIQDTVEHYRAMDVTNRIEFQNYVARVIENRRIDLAFDIVPILGLFTFGPSLLLSGKLDWYVAVVVVLVASAFLLSTAMKAAKYIRLRTIEMFMYDHLRNEKIVRDLDL